jgi:hypothetical protein
VRGGRLLAGDNVVLEHTPEGTRVHAKRGGRQSGGGSSDIRQATIVSGITALQDYLLCSVEGESGTSTKVAKPWLLRVSQFNNVAVNGITYVYTNGQLRKATYSRTGVSYIEWQSITPTWAAGDVLFVTKPTESGTGVTGAEWQDINADGRCWAETFVD